MRSVYIMLKRPLMCNLSEARVFAAEVKVCLIDLKP